MPINLISKIEGKRGIHYVFYKYYLNGIFKKSRIFDSHLN